MSSWNEDDLDRIGGAEELQSATQRPDGTLRPYVTIWVVRADDDLYVRSAYGPHQEGQTPWNSGRWDAPASRSAHFASAR